MSYQKADTRTLIFPYECQSPTLNKKITYDEDELWREIDRILAEDERGKFTPGANLYHNLILCADASYFLDSETNMVLEEYMAMKRFNIPLAASIDEVEYNRLVVFSAIDEEYNACIKAEQDGKK
jgi:hypothetical protein